MELNGYKNPIWCQTFYPRIFGGRIRAFRKCCRNSRADLRERWSFSPVAMDLCRATFGPLLKTGFLENWYTQCNAALKNNKKKTQWQSPKIQRWLIGKEGMDQYFLWKRCTITKELNHKHLLKLLSQDSGNKVRSQDKKKSKKGGSKSGWNSANVYCGWGRPLFMQCSSQCSKVQAKLKKRAKVEAV